MGVRGKWECLFSFLLNFRNLGKKQVGMLLITDPTPALKGRGRGGVCIYKLRKLSPGDLPFAMSYWSFG